ncbi:MAG: dihydropteroate synthase [Halioglobus sp.]
MGVINTTPDSFSDGGTLYSGSKLDVERAFERAKQMVEAGARLLDVGGESTRPGAKPVSAEQEADRVLPLLRAIVAELDVIVSVDTSSPQLMIDAAAAGAGMLNDVRALGRDSALASAASTGLPVCLMHMQGNPDTMQSAPHYDDVVKEVGDYLDGRVEACVAAGIDRDRIVLDPGFGFGKTVDHNLKLLQALPQLAMRGMPVLAGLSRKSMIAKLIGRDVDSRMAASLALAVMAVERGANIIRTHDVAETVDAVAMAVALAGVNNNV